jgi:hypothetical protein
MNPEKKCPSCGSTRLEPGTLQTAGRVNFRPENTKFFTLGTGDVSVEARHLYGLRRDAVDRGSDQSQQTRGLATARGSRRLGRRRTRSRARFDSRSSQSRQRILRLRAVRKSTLRRWCKRTSTDAPGVGRRSRRGPRPPGGCCPGLAPHPLRDQTCASAVLTSESNIRKACRRCPIPAEFLISNSP